MSRQVRVYRSSRRQDVYLFVDIRDDLGRVPEVLMKQFGRPVEVMELALHTERKLARADAQAVLERIDSEGFYLQMPPVLDSETAD